MSLAGFMHRGARDGPFAGLSDWQVSALGRRDKDKEHPRARGSRDSHAYSLSGDSFLLFGFSLRKAV